MDAEALYFFLALFRTGTLPRAAEQLGISLSSANRMLAKFRTYWDDPLFVNSPGNGWFNPKNPDRIALVTPFFLAASLCLEETDCYAIVPKATAELALDPRRTAILELSDAAPKLTVRLGWHERTHADPGSQLIRAQLLALIQKRFGRPAGE